MIGRIRFLNGKRNFVWRNFGGTSQIQTRETRMIFCAGEQEPEEVEERNLRAKKELQSGSAMSAPATEKAGKMVFLRGDETFSSQAPSGMTADEYARGTASNDMTPENTHGFLSENMMHGLAADDRAGKDFADDATEKLDEDQSAEDKERWQRDAQPHQSSRQRFVAGDDDWQVHQHALSGNAFENGHPNLNTFSGGLANENPDRFSSGQMKGQDLEAQQVAGQTNSSAKLPPLKFRPVSSDVKK